MASPRSPRLLFPLEGLNLKQGECGELFGYRYLPLPPTDPRLTTAGAEIPSGNQSRTLFLNAASFEGPVAFFMPYFGWRAAQEPAVGGKLLLSASGAPENLGLKQYRLDAAKEKPQKPCTAPDDPASCWKKPGPAAGPFQTRLGDGSVVACSWYWFADQITMLTAGLTREARKLLQKRVEKLPRAWTKDRDYLAPHEIGTHTSLAPALIVTPPHGLEVGYVPIATRREIRQRGK
jgi:hypothetical protein